MALARPLFTTGTGPPVRAKFGGMQVSEVKRLKDLEDENRRLKKMFADLSLQHEITKEALQKKW
jgi:putative transposase